MAVKILDGKKHADSMIEESRAKICSIADSGGRIPSLAVAIVGEDPASQVYVRNKVSACEKTGIRSVEHRLEASITQEALSNLIYSLNSDGSIDGILIQLPLPKHLDTKQILRSIDPSKDVDGLHPYNQGLLLQGDKGLRPCTPSAVMHMLKANGIALKGARAVVIGRSEIVGKPMAIMLLEEHATVTIAHSRTQNLPNICKEADVLVAAVGKPGLVEGSWIKPGSVVVDVGMNEITNELEAAKIFSQEPKKIETLRAKGRVLCGDVRFGEAANIAGAITPVPGGVGPLTIAGLMMNTIMAYESKIGG